MAKARDIPIHPDEPYAQTAARVVRVRADELFADREDVLDVSDIERVHAMRVASRRLRAVLEIFAPCFPKTEYREVLRDVKALADALGERRDPDVHIEAMEAFAAAADPLHKPGVETLIAHLRARQADANLELGTALTEVADNDLHARLLALADAAVAEPAA